MSIPDVLAPRFREFSNPATGETIRFTAIAQDGEGDLLRFNWRSQWGGPITEHLHPHLILPLLAALAKVFGVRPYYDRWDTRLPAR
jgi:hypothetical protein